MSYLLQVDFPYQGPWGNEMAPIHVTNGEFFAVRKFPRMFQ